VLNYNLTHRRAQICVYVKSIPAAQKIVEKINVAHQFLNHLIEVSEKFPLKAKVLSSHVLVDKGKLGTYKE